MLSIYGAIGAAASVFGVGVASKEFVDRVERIEHNLSLLDRVAREKEKNVSDERELTEAYQMLSRIEDAKRTTAANDAARRQEWLRSHPRTCTAACAAQPDVISL